jgi:hypothetical protein
MGQPAVLSTVFLHWSAIVGDVLARHCTPVDVRRGVLRIDVDEAAWATELQFFAAGIVERVAALSGVAATEPGGVGSIVVRVARRSGGVREGVRGQTGEGTPGGFPRVVDNPEDSAGDGPGTTGRRR